MLPRQEESSNNLTPLLTDLYTVDARRLAPSYARVVCN
jgi:hypothetical protein